MAGNPFFSGRIPQNLHDRIQEHCDATGETKTQVLIQALAAYLDHPLETESQNNDTIKDLKKDLENLDSRLQDLEQILNIQDGVPTLFQEALETVRMQQYVIEELNSVIAPDSTQGDDNGHDNSTITSMNQSELARRLGVNKSQISRRKTQTDFEHWSQEHDPDAIAWKYDDEKKLFVPQHFGG